MDDNEVMLERKDFVAIYMPGGLDKKWFETEKEAWNYIKSRSCEPNCIACEAEWWVLTREEYEEE